MKTKRIEIRFCEFTSKSDREREPQVFIYDVNCREDYVPDLISKLDDLVQEFNTAPNSEGAK